jgi:hypothetical protein
MGKSGISAAGKTGGFEEKAEDKPTETEHSRECPVPTVAGEALVPTEDSQPFAAGNSGDLPASGAVEIAEESFVEHFSENSDQADGASQEKPGNMVVVNAYSATYPAWQPVYLTGGSPKG